MVKIVIAYTDVHSPANDKGKAIVGTVYLVLAISFGSAVTFNSGSYLVSIACAVFDSTNGKVVISYQDQINARLWKRLKQLSEPYIWY